MMKSEKIYGVLKQRIADGTYAPGARFPSEDTLLVEFGVSKVTINKIVSRLAAEGLLIRGVRGAGTRVAPQVFRPRGNIAFIGRLNAYSMAILHGVQQECLRQNFFPAVFSPEAEALPYCLGMMNPKTVTGIITVGYGILKPECDLPLVCLDYNFPHTVSCGHVHFIGSNNFLGGKAMIREVLKRGHREIAIFSAERFVFGMDAPIAPRVQGFHDALREAGYGNPGERTFYGMPDSPADARACLTAILKKYPETSIICADSDHSAEMISQAAKAMNISCPGRIALTGFGNVTHLEIASVNQHPERQGQLAVRWILSGRESTLIEGKEIVETEVTGAEFIPIRL